MRNVASGTALYDDLAFEGYSPHPLSPVPEDGAIIPGGNVALNWTNLPPNTGSDVWVDVWFGTDPENLTQAVDGALNTNTVNVNVAAAGTYYWRVDSYLDGDPNGTAVQTPVISFIVVDTDGDGMPDFFELAYTNPPSATGLNPGDDLDSDGLTNLQEFQIGTNPLIRNTDGDSLLDGVETNTGVWVGASNTSTSPLRFDSDGDGLSDGVETNTGVWVSASNTGTNPLTPDTDGDGLRDGVETNTGVYVSRFDTGSNPHLKDTDGDGAGDYYEAVASLTNPSDASSKPNIPYPLPAPDGTHGAMNKPVKVYIMSGQSNMVGIGYMNGPAAGSLETITARENKFPHFRSGGGYSSRNDVIYKGFIGSIAQGALTAGMGADGSRVGVELGFGHVMGYYHDEPVLLLKASEGNRSLGWDFLPPGSPRWTSGTTTYAGYGDTAPFWPTGETPGNVGWYGGKQYDDCFNAVKSILNSNGTLQGLPSVNGQTLNGRGYEIAGFVWWQGHKDQDGGSIYSTRYPYNLVNIINELRDEFNAPGAPFVLGAIGFGGPPLSGKPAAFQAVYNAQMSVDNPANKIITVETFPYWRSITESPGTQDFHYNNNAETYTLVGDALARAMIDLQVDETPPSPNPMTFAIATAGAGNGSVGMVATTATDVSGPVEYWFQNTTNGNNSGWITSATWINIGLTNGVSYDFQVKARDARNNETGLSAVASATAGPDITAPTPNPMTFSSPPAATGQTTMTMTATTATDFNGVEYFFDCTVGGGPDSGWQASPVFNATGLNHSTSYTYVARARDSLGNTTGNSAPASATTQAPNIVPSIGNPNFDPTAEITADNPSPGYGPISSWTSSGGNSGVNKTNDPFLGTQAAHSGTHVAFIQSSGNISQSLKGFDPSKLYAVTYHVSERGFTPPGGTAPVTSTSVSLDGGVTSFVQSDPIRRTHKFRRIVSGPLPVSAVTSTLRIVSQGFAGDNTLLIDTIGISRAVPCAPDSGFENPVQPGTGAAGFKMGNGSGSGTLVGSLWDFGASLNGIVRNGSDYTSTTPEYAPEGSQAAILLSSGEFSTTVSGFELGVTYTLSFAALGRVGGFGPNTVRVQLGDQTLTFAGNTSVAPGQAAWATYTTEPFTTTGRNLPLIFIGLTDGDKSTFIDDVRFNFVAEAVVNPASGFADYIANPACGLDPADQGFGDDPDGDGLANGLEAWFGTHPGEFCAGLVGIATIGNTTTFTHPQNDNMPGDVSGFYQWSPNLVDWYAGDGVDGPPGGATVTITSDTAGAATTVTVIANNPQGRLFLRVGVVWNQS